MNLRPTRAEPSPLDVLGPDRRSPATPPVEPRNAIVDCAVYVDGMRLPETLSPQAALAAVRSRESGFVWLGLHEPSDQLMNSIAAEFGLHELVVEDAVHAHQRPKLERYDDFVVLVLRTAHYLSPASIQVADDVVDTGEILIVIGPDFVVTVRHGDHSGLAKARKQLESSPQRLALGPWAVLHAVLDRVVNGYTRVISSVERDIDIMEAEILSPNRLVPTEPIYLLKREVLELRRSVNPLATALTSLSRKANDPLVETAIPKDIRARLRDVADNHSAVAERIVEFDEVLSSLVDAAMARVSMQQNTDLRKITAWIAIASFPTVFAGVHGMNFDVMPELHWTYGYLVWWTVTITGCVGLFATFRRREWL